MKIQTAFVLLAAVTSAAAMGCGSSGDKGGVAAGTTRASLHRAKGCGDLLADLKADATFKLNKGIDRQIESIQKCIVRGGTDASCAYGGYYYGGGRGGFGGGEEAALDSNASGAPQSGSTAPTSPAPKASSHSETNTQVKGVDEADFVKTDGSNLYVLHGRAFKVLKAWPANDLAELASLDIEGTPSEMFVDGGKVVVYSQVNGASLYPAAGVTPKASYQDYYGYGYGGGGGDVRNVGAPETAPYPGPGGTPQQYIPLTKITVLTLNGTTPSVAREMYFEGSYLDSRRVGTHVRTVFSGNAHGPKLKYSIYELYPQPTYPTYPTYPGGETKDDGTGTYPTQDPTTNPYPKTGTEMIAALEQLRAFNKAAIDGSQLSDWMPYTFTKEGTVVRASTVACEDFYVPTTGSTESGLTEIASIDLANPAALPRQSAILGHAETVYGSADTIYLAAHAWVEPPYTWMDGADGTTNSGSGSTGSGTIEPAPAPSTPPSDGSLGTKTLKPQTDPAVPQVITAWANNQTHVHKFEFATDAGFPNYVASGTVLGSVKDQFSLDDRGGFLRIATTENRSYLDQSGKYVQPSFPGQTTGPTDRPQTVNHVFVMGVSGGWLDLVGDVGELAPNERIYSVRFVDGRGYVVTFRQVDPLFVLDLNNPKAPAKIAELKIPGFSEYMHPLDATHILTIGRDATVGGQQRGLQLQIFDVTNGANPVLAHKFTYTGSEYGSSEAEHDHKAFTYFADRQLLAFPYYAYTPTTTTGGGMRSSLELFNVNIGSGFAKLGSVDHTSLVSNSPTGYCGGYYGPQVRRGVFLDNFVYAISYGGVVAKDANNLAGAGSTLPLSAPLVNDGYGYGCAEPATDGGGGL
jgi:hypothetical protein